MQMSFYNTGFRCEYITWLKLNFWMFLIEIFKMVNMMFIEHIVNYLEENP